MNLQTDILDSEPPWSNPNPTPPPSISPKPKKRGFFAKLRNPSPNPSPALSEQQFRGTTSPNIPTTLTSPMMKTLPAETFEAKLKSTTTIKLTASNSSMNSSYAKEEFTSGISNRAGLESPNNFGEGKVDWIAEVCIFFLR